ncbi:unnamed protein product [Heligmosomoides polygyrus]|uniref:Calpain catalytic domain-containing protein n=1 Tax=Heligmosomoides polygyrus TaxID=6339 RepID=A0A183GKW0_HELPZ|nr:unnamed protein product [Heligmosomoides polygyrus]
MLKNPWTHLRWKGRYSENDAVSWTPALCKALDYDPNHAKTKDDGVFWIDFESADFADNKEYITVMVYKSGKKIYIPSTPPIDPKPLYEGVRINSPHYLCQMVVTEPGPQKYTLVVAQYEKMKTIYYTLRVFSSCQFGLSPIKDCYAVKKTETGKWEGKTAGGCGNGASRETWQNNPLYQLSLEESSDENVLLIDLKGPKQYSVGFEVRQVSSPRNKSFERKDSGVYRPGYTVLALEKVPAGVYTVRPMTFEARQEGPFILKVEASCGFTMKKIQ